MNAIPGVHSDASPRLESSHRTVGKRRKSSDLRIRKAKLFLFLRQIRHELFDVEFQQELAKVFKDSRVAQIVQTITQLPCNRRIVRLG
jgi:hypothetical protein